MLYYSIGPYIYTVHECWVTFDSLRPHGLYSLPGPSVHGIFQTRILKWVAISFSRGSYWLGDRTWVFRISCIGRQILYHWAPWEAQYIYHIFFIHSFAELHLGCFHVLAIIILLSHKKEWKWVLCSDVEEPTVCHTKWIRKRKVQYINAYVWNLEKMVLMNLFIGQG